MRRVRMIKTLSTARETESTAASAISIFTKLLFAYCSRMPPRRRFHQAGYAFGPDRAGSQIMNGAAKNAQQQKQNHACRKRDGKRDVLLDQKYADNGEER